MRIVVTLQPPEQGALVPIQYNHLVQGAIYQALPPDDQAFFHDQGFVGGGRQFKLFTFSRLLGRYEQTTIPPAEPNHSCNHCRNGAPTPPAQPQAAAVGGPSEGAATAALAIGQLEGAVGTEQPATVQASNSAAEPGPTPMRALRFTGPVHLVIASPAIKFVMSLVTGLLQKGHVRIGSVRFAVESVAPEQGDPLLWPVGSVVGSPAPQPSTSTSADTSNRNSAATSNRTSAGTGAVLAPQPGFGTPPAQAHPQGQGSPQAVASTPADEPLDGSVNARAGDRSRSPALSAARPPLGEADLVTARVQTMSPIVVYSTLLRPDGRPYTVYYQPGDPDWTPLVDGNLRKKYQALYGQSEQPVAVDQLPPITVQVFGQPRLSVMRYKSTVIKGYTARLRLTGPLALIRLALDAGLGSKNSQGFGCLQLLSPVEPVVNRRPTADAHRQPLAGSTVQQTSVSGQSSDVGSNDSAPGGKPRAADS